VDEFKETVGANNPLESRAKPTQYDRDQHDEKTVLDNNNEKTSVFSTQYSVKNLLHQKKQATDTFRHLFPVSSA
jgi:hypothetical protein